MSGEGVAGRCRRPVVRPVAILVTETDAEAAEASCLPRVAVVVRFERRVRVLVLSACVVLLGWLSASVMFDTGVALGSD